MNTTPLVPAHRPQFFYVLSTPATMQNPAQTTRPGRQNVLHYKTGKCQPNQIYQTDQINNKI